MKNKITVVGSGFVGATLAQRLAERELGDIIVLDIIEGIPQGKALDMYESAPIESFSGNVTGTNSYKDIAGSDIVIITAGLARKPGMTREDLLAQNARIISQICDEIVQRAPGAIVIIVTNPLDIMTQLALSKLKFPSHRVLGMAGILDSARMRAFIAMELDVSPVDVQAMVLGGHGDAMVPLPRYTTVSGIPVTELLSQDEINRIIARTRDGGAEIVRLLKQGSAFYAPSSAAAEMVEAIVKDQKRVFPCSVMLSGQYGLHNVCLGVPIKLGYSGVLEIIELNLLPDELESLHASAQVVKDNFAQITQNPPAQ